VPSEICLAFTAVDILNCSRYAKTGSNTDLLEVYKAPPFFRQRPDHGGGPGPTAAADVDQSTAEAVGDWHYWLAQGAAVSDLRMPAESSQCIENSDPTSGKLRRMATR
jgi:hypothetical protein